MNHLTKYEQETILLTNEQDSFWNIYTFNKRLKNRLRAFAYAYPELCQLKDVSDNGSVTYQINKDRLSINLKKPYSEERIQKLRDLAKINLKK